MNTQINTILPDIHLVHDIPQTTSLDVAEKFGKRHDHVLRDIQNLDVPEEFSLLNFGESDYKNSRGKSYPMYNITRDGFVLLAMGFTGQKAMQWKIAYLQLFNAMEAKLKAGREALLIEVQQSLLNKQDALINAMNSLSIKGTRIKASEKEVIHSLFAQGLSKVEIGRRTGRSRDTVRRILCCEVGHA